MNTGAAVSYDTNKEQSGYNRTEYAKLEQAFRFFNEKLFDGKLPGVFFTMPRHRGAYGYFRPYGFCERTYTETGDRMPPGFKVHEIAIMPDAMHDRPDREILSTLVHEMCHLRQQEHGTPSRGGYHNREFARMMQFAGLQTSSLGAEDKRNPYRRKKPGPLDQEGADTGQKMSHYIIKDGPFDRVCRELIADGFSFALDAEPALRLKAPKSKFKFTCPGCKANAWAKAGTPLICGKCEKQMRQEDADDDNDND